MPTSTKLSVNNQKGIVQIVVVLFLLVGLAVGLVLVKEKTNLLPKASTGSYCEQFLANDSVCGQKSYNDCDAEVSCDAKGLAYFDCRARQDPNICNGDVYCSTRNSVCGGPFASKKLEVKAAPECSAANTQTIDITWNDVGAASYQINIGEANGWGSGSLCFDANDARVTKDPEGKTLSYNFSQNMQNDGPFPTDREYRVNVAAFSKVNCDNSNSDTRQSSANVENASCPAAVSQVAECNALQINSSGRAYPGEATILNTQGTFSGKPKTMKIWIAANSEINNSAQTVSSWTYINQVTNPGSGSVYPFKVPAEIASGSHVVLMSLHGSDGSMLDGNVGGRINDKCISTINIQ